MKELIALAKAKPGTLHFAHAGVGSFTHTASVLFSMMAGIDTVMVPFKGGGPAMIDVIGGHSQLLMNSYLASLPHVRSGKLRALGVSDTAALGPAARRADHRRGRRARLSGRQLVGHRGAGRHAAGRSSSGSTRRSTRSLTPTRSRRSSTSRARCAVPMSPAEFAKFYDTELEKWGKVVKAAESSRRTSSSRTRNRRAPRSRPSSSAAAGRPRPPRATGLNTLV